MSFRLPSLIATAVFSLALSTEACRAQVDAPCSVSWSPGNGLPGVDHSVAITEYWVQPGVGERVVCAGGFRHAGTLAVDHLAVFDPATGAWSRLGTGGGSDGSARAVVAMPSGDLVIGGTFQVIDGVSASNLARWDGTGWHPVGGGVDDLVTALAVMPTGDLVVAGGFTTTGGVPSGRIASWNGTTWTSLLPVGSGWPWIESMVALPNGDLIVGGQFSSIAGVAAASVARWDGVSWSPLGSGCDGLVSDLVLLPNGGVVAGGNFDDAGGIAVENVALWNGTSWSALGQGVPATEDLEVLPNGDVVAVPFGSGGRVRRWDGSSWQPVGAMFFGSTRAITAMSNGTLVAGGQMYAAGATQFEGVAVWDGAAWTPPPQGIGDRVVTVAELSNGDLVIGGDFGLVDGLDANHIAIRSASGWQVLGAGLDGRASDIAELPNGDLLVVGKFRMAGGMPADYIARWDGQAWHPFGGGLGNAGECITIAANGDIYVGGYFSSAGGVSAQAIARWDGTAWHDVGGSPSPNAFVNTIHEFDNGELWIGGRFDVPGGSGQDHVARWDGVAWSAVGSGLPTIGGGTCADLVEMPNGDVVAIGLGFGVQAWNGTSWNSLVSPSGWGNEALLLDNGDLLVADSFVGMLRRDAAGVWTQLADGLEGAVIDFELTSDGRLVIVGNFLDAGGNGAARFAVLDNTCTAMAETFRSPCYGAAGPIVLAPRGLPWIGAAYRATATGFAASAIALGVLGFGEQPTPLANIHPSGVSGCDLLTSPDYVGVIVPAAGEAEMTIQVPLQATLVGLELRQQLLQVVLGSGLQIVEITGSNGIELTVGLL